jgi:hypothetical protein
VSVALQGGPKVLDKTDWHLQLVMGEGELNQAKDVTTLFDFTLAAPQAAQEVRSCCGDQGWCFILGQSAGLREGAGRSEIGGFVSKHGALCREWRWVYPRRDGV